ncbi:hypothetical protein GNI_103600 [Gregarina niphandrodes]|uniref:Uncharacterized protein n=1 Tax=Gregarina niphandrodes TaxID=110365 RepID=A0A023B490_GRENI|nr:hypothetical protein GNI_103600 [Gregarina niphandrodes]EZG56484.1 hypothetical protein GNI_103600 [Gregarina niphandrodes]|eukprot:XP_011131259.1 hypothetical protein GNI_103600 [Gregarina niphandrodes]
MTEAGSDGWVLILGRYGYPEISSGLDPAVYATLQKLKAKQGLTVLDIGEVGSGELEYMAKLRELTGASKIVRRDPALSFLPTFQQEPELPGTTFTSSGAALALGPYHLVVLDEYEHLWVASTEAGGQNESENLPLVELIPPPPLPLNVGTAEVIYVHRNDAWNIARERNTGALLVRCPSLTKRDFLLSPVPPETLPVNASVDAPLTSHNNKEYAGGLLLLDLAQHKIYEYEWWLDPYRPGPDNNRPNAKDVRPRCQVYNCRQPV